MNETPDPKQVEELAQHMHKVCAPTVPWTMASNNWQQDRMETARFILAREQPLRDRIAELDRTLSALMAAATDYATLDDSYAVQARCDCRRCDLTRKLQSAITAAEQSKVIDGMRSAFYEIMVTSGCLEIDNKCREAIANHPSPALPKGAEGEGR